MSDVRQIVPEQFHQPLVSARVPVPMPQAGEVLLRVDVTVICGSDNHTWKGGVPGRLPMVMGHEGMGSIEQLGPNLDRDSGGH
jgi:Zn-dependent alcohol dehydrogenase